MFQSKSHRIAFAVLGMFLITATGCGDGSSGPSTPKMKTQPKPISTAETEQPEASGLPTKTEKSGESEAAVSGTGGETAATGGWGDLSGTFVYDGAPPAQPKINVTKDIEYCSQNPPLVEELVVNQENKGIQNIVLMLSVARGADRPPIHESYANASSQKVVLDNRFCRFEPHVQFVQTGQTLVLGNEDDIGHNVKGDPPSNSAFNRIVAAKSNFEVPLDSAERLPFQVSCNIHPWMLGWVVVQDHPYVAITDENGAFELKNVPSGTWEFQLWQEKAGYLKQLQISGADIKLNRGKWQIAVQDEAAEGNAGKNAFREILVSASNFE